VSPSVPESFRADAAVVWRLGAELFTSTDQALVELIKNSYDAGAEHVRLEIKRPAAAPASDGDDDPPSGQQSLPSPDSDPITESETEAQRPVAEDGSILIIDDGAGMTAEEIVRGWLTLSASVKAEQKQEGIPPDKRVPLGDKGLGRLGAQRLGRKLRLRTRPAAQPGAGALEHDVAIDWGEFQPGRLLSDITPGWVTHTDLTLAEPWPMAALTGTVLEITEPYADDAGWSDETTLQRSLSTVMNPYASVQNFDVTVTVDGDSLDLHQVSSEVRAAALTTWTVSYEKRKLKITGSMRREWFRPKEEERRELLQRQLRTVEGRDEMVERLKARGPISDVSFGTSKSRGFTAEHIVRPDEISGFPGQECGPFRMELDVVSLELGVARELSLSVFDRQADYRKWVRERGGVSIFRDGFVVAAGDDLLQLGKSFTSGGSYYGLRPQNVLGYIGISARENAHLQETTSREDFQRNAAFLRFEAILRLAVSEINRILDESGRAGSEWAKELAERAEGLFGLTGDELVGQAGQVADRSRAAAASIHRAETVLATAEVADDETDEERAQLLRELASAKATLDAAGDLAPVVAHLRDRLAQAQLNYEDLLATAGLGLAAEGLAHDITQVMERLRLRARAAAKVRDGLPEDVELLLDEVEWAAGALRSQLRHLDPMLRYSRLRRTDVNLGKLVRDTAAFHRDRLHPQGIVVTASVSKGAQVRLSPGRLGQVLDNLVHNSVYWLLDRGDYDGGAPTIHFAVEGSEIVVSDNGPGVAPELGSRAFEPFVTRKHEGRGLGLWLVRQLLDLDQASIDLEQDPGTGRLNRFRIRYPSLGASQ
jgi:signal transduction histidine kinase